MNWTAIMNAHGEATKLGEYKTKKAAVEAIQMEEGTDTRPNKWGEVGNHMAVKTQDVANMGYNFDA